jgi:hypothetical protein
VDIHHTAPSFWRFFIVCVRLGAGAGLLLSLCLLSNPSHSQTLSLRDFFFERKPLSQTGGRQKKNGKKNCAFVSGNLRKLIEHFAV